MYCPNCDLQNNLNGDFCVACGYLVTTELKLCPVCKILVAKDWVFCLHCGTSLKQVEVIKK